MACWAPMACWAQTWHRIMSYKGHTLGKIWVPNHVDGLLQDCSNSSASAMELLQSCAKPSICPWDTILQRKKNNNWLGKDIQNMISYTFYGKCQEHFCFMLEDGKKFYGVMMNNDVNKTIGYHFSIKIDDYHFEYHSFYLKTQSWECLILKWEFLYW